ncbi:MAG: ABC transporter permease, partial [Planctomycetes bacterium]|nr:ABC transporter permease [Planctomycetota bacterium]
MPHIDFFTHYYTLFLSPMFLFSGVFFPTSTLPAWARVLS